MSRSRRPTGPYEPAAMTAVPVMDLVDASFTADFADLRLDCPPE
ncbi:hypothetical protein ACQ4WX_37015 [Streptomyces lasalocidi]